MPERCPNCQQVVDDTGVAAGGFLRCGRCKTGFHKAKVQSPVVDANKWTIKDGPRDLDIHPMLRRKYQAAPPVERGFSAPEEPPPPVAGPQTRVVSEVHDTDEIPLEPSPATTNPGRPLARRSNEGAVPKDPPRAAEPAPARPQRPAEPAPDAAPVIPGYEVTELVGKGAMGRVYRARHLASGKPSAIKILAPDLAARIDFIQRFEREGAAMRAVKHPGVVAVLDTGSAAQPDGSTAHYICMEFIEGPPLRRFLERGAVAPEKALRLARLIIQGLEAAHARGIIHRDLKPENILAPPAPEGEERLVIVDFGLAGILNEDNDPHPNLTKSRMTMGTVNYMAPEQRTDAKRVDQRADIYAAGVMLYELLTGDLPLGRYALPTERGVAVPASVDECLLRALAPKQENRYQTASQFDADLEKIQLELQRTAGQDTIIGRARGPGSGRGPTNRRTMIDDVITTGDLIHVGTDGAATAWVSAAPFIRRPSLLWASAAFAGVLLYFLLASLLHR